MNKIIWICGMMCVGKTTFSNKLGELLNKTPFHLDHIDQSIPLVEAYKEAIKTGLIEGFTPHRNNHHYQAIMEALKGYDIIYLQLTPSYEDWLIRCQPVFDKPTDENPPSYTKEEYEAENQRINKLTNSITICN
jgi:deoxyadenosine/deoxycytidine kinase